MFCLLFFALFCLHGLAQVGHGTLKVVIKNAEEDDVIAAHVIVYDGDHLVSGAATDVYGLAFVPNLAPGTYRVEISHVGFKSLSMEIVIHPNNIHTRVVNMNQEVILLNAGDERELVIYNRPIIMLNPFGGPDTWQNCYMDKNDRL